MNLVGISGKKNAGKDTVAQMLMYLYAYQIAGYTHPITVKDYRDWLINDHLSESTIEIKGYSDKLKDSVCSWIGCTREQLEDREFKEKPLGKEWWYHLVDGELIPYKDYPTSSGDDNIVKLTPRKLMQLLGTECGRKILHPNMWVNALFADRIPQVFTKDNRMTEKYPKWIVTDVRFPNEAKAIRDRGGKLIRINRPKDPIEDGMDNHASEVSLDSWEDWDMVIWNREGLAELLTEVKKFHDRNKWR